MRRMLVACGFCGVVALTRPAASAPLWNLSLPSDESDRLGLESSRALFERTLAIELRDETIVGRPAETSDAVCLYIRVSYEGANLRVEVWDRGDPAGARVVSGHGAPALVARRVALTTVELVRKLSQRRAVARRRELERELDQRREEAAQRARIERERPQLIASLRGTGFPSMGAALGPELGIALNGDTPLRFGVALGYGLGAMSALPGPESLGSTSFSMWSVELSAAYVALGSKSVQFSFGPSVRASSLHVSGPAELARRGGGADGLTAQAGLFLQAEPRLSRNVSVFVRTEAALVLAPLALRVGSSEARLEGLALGLAFGASLDF